MKITVKASGFKELKAKFREARKFIATERQPAMMEAAREIAVAAAARTPRESGELAAAIHAEPAGKNRAKIVVNNDHAAAVEFGTSKMAAKPYLRPAIDSVGPAALERAAQKLGRLMETKLGE